MEISIKKLKLEHGTSISGSESSPSGTSTPISWSSPVPPATTQLSKKDISEFKPKNSLSAELTYLEMQDWKVEPLNWFKIGNHAALESSMQTPAQECCRLKHVGEGQVQVQGGGLIQRHGRQTVHSVRGVTPTVHQKTAAL